MMINEMERNKLLDLLNAELENNAYDKSLLELKKKLDTTRQNDLLLTVADAEYILSLDAVFADYGIFKDRKNITKEERDKALLIMKGMLDLHEAKKELWQISKANTFKCEKDFMDYLDKYNMKISSVMVDISRVC